MEVATSHEEFVACVEELLKCAEKKAVSGATFETALRECLRRQR